MRSLALRDVCKLITDGTHYTPPDIGAGIPFLTVKDIDDQGTLDFEGCSKIAGDEYARAAAGNSAPNVGDVLFSKDGTVGKVSVVREPKNFAVLSSIAILRPNIEVVDSEYLGHALKSPSALDQALKRKTGSAIRRIILSDLKGVRLPIPSLVEQRRIAAILDKADALRAKRREAIKKLDLLLQSVFLDMFGDPVKSPKADVVPLASICSRITDGTHQSPRWAESGVPFLFQSNVKPGEINYETKKTISLDEHEALTIRCPIEFGDVLYTIVGSYGNAAMVRTNDKFCFQRHIAHLKPAPGVVPEFLEGMMNHPAVKRQADERVTGIAQKTLILKELKALKVFKPKIEHQQRFKRISDELRSARQRAIRHADATEVLFASIQYQAFNGRT